MWEIVFSTNFLLWPKSITMILTPFKNTYSRHSKRYSYFNYFSHYKPMNKRRHNFCKFSISISIFVRNFCIFLANLGVLFQKLKKTYSFALNFYFKNSICFKVLAKLYELFKFRIHIVPKLRPQPQGFDEKWKFKISDITK